MKIGVFTDLRFTALETPTGVTKHIEQMVHGLNKHPNFEIILLATKDQVNRQGEISPTNTLHGLTVRVLPYYWHELYWRSLLFDFPTLDKHTVDLDLVYCPKNDYIPLMKTKYVVTFHGAHELDPDYSEFKTIPYFKKWRSRKIYKRMVEQATIILTVSSFLKQKTVEVFNVDPNKIKVVGNGVEEEFFNIKSNSDYSTSSYYLCVGGMNFLDGGDRIIQVADILKKNNNDQEIWIAGNQHQPELMAKAQEYKNIRFLGYLKKDKLAEFMSQASALLFLTRYETFGIAAAEAMAVGIPVICTSSTAIPEIVGKSGFYVKNANNFEFGDLALDEERVLERISLGRNLANSFHWNNCIGRLTKAIKETAS